MGAHLVDSCVYGHLWATPELRRLFDDSGRFQSWLEILAALAEAQAEVGLVPADAARAIRDHADVTLLNLDRVGAVTRSTGHSTLGLIRCLAEVLPAQAREWVYYGGTVQDLSDTWTVRSPGGSATCSNGTCAASRSPPWRWPASTAT